MRLKVAELAVVRTQCEWPHRVIGSATHRKGQLDLIKALPRILLDAPNVKVALVGGQVPHYVKECRECASSLNVSNRIIWTGERNDIPDLLVALDVFVLPSLEETLPISILEAMAAGTPVVATDVGGVSECVQTEVNGLLVPPARQDALAEAILRLLGSPKYASRLVNEGRRLAKQRYSQEAVVARVEQVFQQLCRRHVRRLSKRSRRQGRLPSMLSSSSLP